MAAAYVEHRPKSTDKEATVSHCVIVSGGSEKHGSFKTQHEAKDKACSEGYRPVHVAASATSTNPNPDHFRKDPC